MPRVASPTFVGRRDELERVVTALADARAGRPRVLLIGGEAGVGKTRLVRELERLALGVEMRVLEGGCLPIGGEGLPFGAVTEALRALAQTTDPGELETMAGGGRAELARLMPELGRPTDAARPPDDGSGQGRLFEHLLRFLGQVSSRTPLAIVLEDIHWADRSTLELLAFLVRNLGTMRVVLVATYRTDEPRRRHPLTPLLAELDRSGTAERIDLGRFDRHELEAQLEGILGVPPEGDLVARIAARSQGNAFYAEELLAARESAGELPATLRDVLLVRLTDLTAEARDVVRVASASGQRIAAARLAAVTGMRTAELEDRLREAVARQILVVGDSHGSARLTFRHALMQEAVYSELLPDERTRLHGAFARAIAAERPLAEASRAAELAYHWQAAQDLPRAFDASIQAGISAEAIYAFAEAASHYERALELWEKVPNASARAPIDRVEVLMRIASLQEGPAPTRSIALIRTAIALVDPQRDATRAGLLYERLGRYLWLDEEYVGALAAHEEAVRLVPAEPPSAARSRVLSGLGRYLVGLDRPAEALAICDEARAVAERAAATDVMSRALVPLGAALVLLGQVDAGLAAIRRGEQVARAIGDVPEVAAAMTWLAYAFEWGGRLDEALAAGLEAERYASQHGLSALWAPLAVMTVAPILESVGRWDEAAEALTRAQHYDLTGHYELQVESMLLVLEVARGQAETAKPRAQWLLLHDTAFSWRGYALAEFALWQAEPLHAREAVARVGDAFGLPARHRGWVFAAGIRAEADLASIARSRHAEADVADSLRRGTDLLASMRSAFADAASHVPIAGPTTGALLALCEAEFTRLQGTSDPERWAAAAGAWNVVRMPHLQAYALMREGEAILEQRQDRPRAVRPLTEARNIAARLGALPLLRATEKVAARAGITLEPENQIGPGPIHAARRAGPRGLDELTRREREVLALLGAGKSNAQIGEALFVSRKTVSVHLANIKAKLGAFTRVEMAIYAIETGLVDEAMPAGRSSDNGR